MAIELPVTTRTVLGKKVKELRVEGLVPAELFGRGVENRHLSLSATAAAKAYREAGEHTIVTLVMDSGERVPAVFADVQWNHLQGSLLAVDFHMVRMDEAIEAKVPVRLAGEAPAKKEGFPIVQVMQEIEVRGLPNELPHEILVDVSALAEPGHTIYVRDLTAPKGVKLLAQGDTAVITVGEKTKEEAVAAPVAATAETATPTTATETTEEK